ncbi:MAG TPA: ATP-binding protein [Candidatus Faecalibacterium gallistercoris]|uniref:ATP-binding protein n=1 Tax=Candidatus Faecalibacterium gallistercoris TaxID=2838579 RepID=A0A9D2FEB9_9FIRM|nr:ATP-binding protein [Candidatus Faecalibacterium gallistercoris]
MRTRNELYQAALRTVSARRQRAKAAAQDARAQAEAAVPELRAAEDALRACGVRCALAGARGAGRAEAAAALAEARQKRDALLAASGRSPQALEPKFTCPLCQDTGVAQGKTCQCVRREMQRLRREEIEAMSSLSVTRFDTMKLDYYPNTRDPQTGRSVRQYMAELLADLQDYAAAFDLDSENLMLTGNAGLGKTHAALAVAGAALDKGYDVIYISSPDFFSRVETLHFGSDPAGEKDALLETVTGADLLILDDLGTEFNSSFVISTLYSLLNDRLGRRRPTILTTNITDGALLEKLYTEKVASRISAFVPYRFLGDDIRLKKAMEE